MPEQNKYVVPLYAARLRDLTWATTITGTCECGHVAEVETLWKRLPRWTSINDLARHLRCASCDQKGRAEINARTALGYDRL